jgi:hypothetical protein
VALVQTLVQWVAIPVAFRCAVCFAESKMRMRHLPDWGLHRWSDDAVPWSSCCRCRAQSGLSQHVVLLTASSEESRLPALVVLLPLPVYEESEKPEMESQGVCPGVYICFSNCLPSHLSLSLLLVVCVFWTSSRNCHNQSQLSMHGPKTH